MAECPYKNESFLRCYESRTKPGVLHDFLKLFPECRLDMNGKQIMIVTGPTSSVSRMSECSLPFVNMSRKPYGKLLVGFTKLGYRPTEKEEQENRWIFERAYERYVPREATRVVHRKIGSDGCNRCCRRCYCHCCCCGWQRLHYELDYQVNCWTNGLCGVFEMAC